MEELISKGTLVLVGNDIYPFVGYDKDGNKYVSVVQDSIYDKNKLLKCDNITPQKTTWLQGIDSIILFKRKGYNRIKAIDYSVASLVIDNFNRITFGFPYRNKDGDLFILTNNINKIYQSILSKRLLDGVFIPIKGVLKPDINNMKISNNISGILINRMRNYYISDEVRVIDGYMSTITLEITRNNLLKELSKVKDYELLIECSDRELLRNP